MGRSGQDWRGLIHATQTHVAWGGGEGKGKEEENVGGKGGRRGKKKIEREQGERVKDLN